MKTVWSATFSALAKLQVELSSIWHPIVSLLVASVIVFVSTVNLSPKNEHIAQAPCWMSLQTGKGSIVIICILTSPLMSLSISH
ncbi:uncharacterized protein EDB93DRAFT_1168545 [Suillus bovinus]|uniref:uncharacterized protein n=1 Tax=Suillus bovinus TaxID=48563 RepID=UPI001B879B42|nr:uncharacterized protein EDB93DRAFT_1168545 [Suillus bovinus]KAG2136602.1 hypothetical protein EDB93DRAFT_1168545 [Suillus bovinus]